MQEKVKRRNPFLFSSEIVKQIFMHVIFNCTCTELKIIGHFSDSLGLRCFASFCCCLMTRQNLPNYVFLETISWSFTSSSRLLIISDGYWYCGLTSFVCTCSMHFVVLFNSVKPWSFWEIGSFIFYFLIYINFGFYHSLISTFVQVAVFYFHDEFTFLKGIGLVTIMFGVSLFNWYK